jgi:hypothetical protein
MRTISLYKPKLDALGIDLANHADDIAKADGDAITAIYDSPLHHAFRAGVASRTASLPRPPATKPTPDQAKWPWWARELAKLAKPEDRGVGDVFHRFAGSKWKDLYIELRKALLIPCGCKRRRETWNELYPLQ